MTRSSLLLSGAAALAMMGSPASAQAIAADDATALRAQIDALRAQVDALQARLDGAAAVAPTPAPAPVIAATTPAAATPPATTTEWRGAPETRLSGGWSFKPRGRIQLDVGTVDAPDAITDAGLGFSNEFRRIYIGFDGTMPGGFGYRVEADLADNAVTLTDAYLTYGRGPLSVTLGQHKPFQSMEDMTSDLFTSFTERAAFNSAFGFERRVGLSATYTTGLWLMQGGVFTDDVSALNNPGNNSWSVDGRIVYSPIVAGTQLHFGGSIHSRTLNDAASSVRYRARPLIHSTDTRFVDTGTIRASGETNYGVEFAAVRGRFHTAGEANWMTTRRPGLSDPAFFGGYVEAGLMLTDDTRVYRKGTFDRVRPRHSIANAGIGAVELNIRYDWLDLTDGASGITGGQQSLYGVSLTWIPTDYVRFIANYGHIDLTKSAVLAGTDRTYAIDVLGLRAQFDF